jgi:hypothetical protein
MATLTKAAILTAQDLEREPIPIAQWKGDVLVRALTAAERARVTAIYTENKEEEPLKKVERAQALMLSMAVINEDGTPMFVESDIPELMKKHHAAVDQLVKAVSRMAGLDVEESKEK